LDFGWYIVVYRPEAATSHQTATIRSGGLLPHSDNPISSNAIAFVGSLNIWDRIAEYQGPSHSLDQTILNPIDYAAPEC
jgi:hypothetical protein